MYIHIYYTRTREKSHYSGAQEFPIIYDYDGGGYGASGSGRPV